MIMRYSYCMIRFTELTVERHYTLNMGNYESVRIGASATVHISEEADPDEAYEQAVEFIDDKLLAEMEALKSDAD